MTIKRIYLITLCAFTIIGCADNQAETHYSCIEETSEQLSGAFKEMTSHDVASPEDLRRSIAALVAVMKDIDLSDCPSDYKFQVNKCKQEWESVLELLSGERFERGDPSLEEEIGELVKIGQATATKIDEVAARYGYP